MAIGVILGPLVDHKSSPARPSDADYAARQKPLDHFRANTKRLQIHPLEIGALSIVGLHVTLLPWALGGMRLWAQIPSLILAIVGFVVAMIPRNYTEDHTGSNRFRLIIWPKETIEASNATVSGSRPAPRTSEP